MTVLQIPEQATNTIIEQWGAPGAIIIIIIVAVAFFGRYLAKREATRNEYDKVKDSEREKRYHEIQNKNDIHLQTIAASNEKLSSTLSENTEVIKNNSIALNNNSETFKLILGIWNDDQEIKDFIKNSIKK